MSLYPNRRQAAGFTIVELIIVIVVIGILSAVAIIGYNGVRQSAAGATLQSDLRNAAQYVKLAAAENGSVPPDLSAFSTDTGVTFEYTPGNGTYCITASFVEAGASYYYDSQTGEQLEGTCPGHSGLGGGEPIGLDPATSWGHFSVGSREICSVVDGKAYCWGGFGGGNAFGGLGQGSLSIQPTPSLVDDTGAISGKTIKLISAGGNFSCAVDTDNAIYCWGFNTDNAIGLGTSINTPRSMGAMAAIGSRNITSITSGSNHTCVIADGQAFCWGRGTTGALGDGVIANRSTAVAVSTAGVLAGKTVTKISAGSGGTLSHTCAIADGAAYCWGEGSSGRLGNGGTTRQSTPVAVSTAGVLAGRTVTDIDAGSDHTCAIADAQAFCWGWGNVSAVGDGTTTQRNSPVAVSTAGPLSGVSLTGVTTGNGTSCAFNDTRLFCWGTNGLGRYGNGTTTSSSSPVEVNIASVLNGRTIVDMYMRNATCMKLSDGEAYCWGYNVTDIPIGTGSTTNVLTPELLIAPWL